MAESLGLSEEACKSKEFTALFSGDLDAIKKGFKSPWATPYALSIYGEEMYQNCPYGTGNGYGDGRAISISEVVVGQEGSTRRWELQLKGAGTTPFARSGDGRAVLRSSVREFLTSEAMFHLGVSTTRALSLIASETERVMRPWFSDAPRSVPTIDDPRLARYPKDLLPMLLYQLHEAMKEPDMMQESICAIVCRVAPSFLRVGHIELFGRRVRKAVGEQKASALKELELIVEHVIFREYPHINTKLGKDSPLQERALAMLDEASERMATLTAEWLRVGYTQGNFNSDNCLVAGRTMDYGPFGFVERFEPLWNMWTGGGEHYSFINQPNAGAKNFSSFVNAVMPLFDEEGKKKAKQIRETHVERAMNAANETWSKKLGFGGRWSEALNDLLKSLLGLMEECQADYTITWRQLAYIIEGCDENTSDLALFEHIRECFYRILSITEKNDWVRWLRRWMTYLAEAPRVEVAKEIKRYNPKFVPREWMLVKAYNAANDGDFSYIHEFEELFATPYDEHEGEMSEKYYKKAPPETYEGVGRGGTAYMT